MFFAAIDIGSNAGRLLIANVFELGGVIKIEKDTFVRVPLRLGVDVFNSGEISQEKQQIVLSAFKAFSQLIDLFKPISVMAFATSAMRDASNSKEIVSLIKQQSGINLEVIDGIDEARFISSMYQKVNKKGGQSVYIDVGGGSTEISVYKGSVLIAECSFEIGTLRNCTNLLESDEWRKLKSFIERNINIESKIRCICTGGNINKLQAMYGKKDPEMLHFSELKAGYDYISSFTLQERIEKLGLRPDRADVIIPASEIFIDIMKLLDVNKIRVPKMGLADGMIYNQYLKYKESF